jgi:biopolymer transport protein ExbD
MQLTFRLIKRPRIIMNLRGRNKVSEFNMSSMTDIFLLLIFFMLTSTMVTYQCFRLGATKSKRKTDSNKIYG